MLAACALLGVTEVHAAGGAQAIAMLGYGTADCPPVDIISGPGNVYVAAAKRLLLGRVGTDAEAGPTEVAIIADGSADPVLVAADLVAQAEHDSLAACLLITTDPGLADRVDERADRQVAAARHRERIEAALAGQSACVLVDDTDAALAVADAWAPEHLEIQAEGPPSSPAGSATPARCSSGRTRRCRSATTWRAPTTCCPPAGPPGIPAGLSVLTFLRGIHVVEYDAAALAAVAPYIDALGGAEDLAAHVNAVRVRRRSPHVAEMSATVIRVVIAWQPFPVTACCTV